jgi:hypothetical protein
MATGVNPQAIGVNLQATGVKYMWVANLVDPWRGDSSGPAVQDFFTSINEAAELGRLRGHAKLFYSTQPRLC